MKDHDENNNKANDLLDENADDDVIELTELVEEESDSEKEKTLDPDAETIIAPPSYYDETVGVSKLLDEDGAPSSPEADESNDYEETIGIGQLLEEDDDDDGVLELDEETIVAPPDLYEQTVGIGKLLEDNSGPPASEAAQEEGLITLDEETIMEQPDLYEQTIGIGKLLESEEDGDDIVDLDDETMIAPPDAFDETMGLGALSEETAKSEEDEDFDAVVDLDAETIISFTETDGEDIEARGEPESDEAEDAQEDVIDLEAEGMIAEEEENLSPPIDRDASKTEEEEPEDSETDDFSFEDPSDKDTFSEIDLRDAPTESTGEDDAAEETDALSTEEISEEGPSGGTDIGESPTESFIADEDASEITALEEDALLEPPVQEEEDSAAPDALEAGLALDEDILDTEEDAEMFEERIVDHTPAASDSPDESPDLSPPKGEDIDASPLEELDLDEEHLDSDMPIESLEKIPEEDQMTEPLWFPEGDEETETDVSDAASIEDDETESLDLDDIIEKTTIDKEDIFDLDEASAPIIEKEADLSEIEGGGFSDPELFSDLGSESPEPVSDFPLESFAEPTETMEETDIPLEPPVLDAADEDPPDMDPEKERDLLDLLDMDLEGKTDAAADVEEVDLLTDEAAEDTEISDDLEPGPHSEAHPGAGRIEPPEIGATPAEPDADLAAALEGIAPEAFEAALERVIKKVFEEKIESVLFNAVEKVVSREIQKLKDVLITDASMDD